MSFQCRAPGRAQDRPPSRLPCRARCLPADSQAPCGQSPWQLIVVDVVVAAAIINACLFTVGMKGHKSNRSRVTGARLAPRSPTPPPPRPATPRTHAFDTPGRARALSAAYPSARPSVTPFTRRTFCSFFDAAAPPRGDALLDKLPDKLPGRCRRLSLLHRAARTARRGRSGTRRRRGESGERAGVTVVTRRERERTHLCAGALLQADVAGERRMGNDMAHPTRQCCTQIFTAKSHTAVPSGGKARPPGSRVASEMHTTQSLHTW